MITLEKGTGYLSIDGRKYAAAALSYYINPDGLIDIYNLYNDREIISFTPFNQITDASTGNALSNRQALVDFMTSSGVAVNPSGGSGAGGGSSDASAANQLTEITRLTSIRDNQVAGPKTSATSQSITPATDATFAVSLASSPLPTNAATASNQSAGNTSLSSIDNKTPALVGGAVPVVASTLPLPTGASTSTLQTTGNNSLASIDGKTPILGQGTMAQSVPVTLASDQGAFRANADGLFSVATNPNVPTTVGSELFSGLVGQAKCFFLQFKETRTGFFRVQFSNDNVTWSGSTTCQLLITNTQLTALTPTTTEVFKIPVYGAYMKISVASALSGTSNGLLYASYDDRAYDLSTFNITGVISGAVTNLALGNTTDTSATTDTGTFSLVALTKRQLTYLNPIITYTDLSTVATANGTSTQLVAANAAGYSILVQNLSAVVIWINFGAAATTGAGSIPITQYGSFDSSKMGRLTQACNILVPTNGVYTAKSY